MWQKTKDGLYKQFIFSDFKQAFDFMALVADLAEKHQHHPRWQNEYNKVDIWLCTHDEGNRITDKDEEMAKGIDAVSSKVK